MARSWRQLGEQFGVSHTAARGWAQRDDWPLPKRRPPFSAAELKRLAAWREGLQEDRARDAATPAGGPDLNTAYKAVQIRLKTEQAKISQLKREILNQEHVRREMLDGALGGLAAVFVQVFDEMELSWPERFPALAEQRAEFVRLLDHYRRRIVEKGEFELQRLTDVAAHTRAAGRGRPRAG